MAQSGTSINNSSVPGFGRCIYCDSDGGDDGLQREHVWPKSLLGTFTILKASCRKCATETCKLEDYLANKSFGEFRIHRNIRSGRRKTAPPEKLPVNFRLAGTKFDVELPLDERPYSLSMPQFGPPRILTGEVDDRIAGKIAFHNFMFLPGETPDPSRRLADTPGIGIRVDYEVIPATFLRAVAKIAYCSAVAQFGIDAFDPLGLRDVILGKDDCCLSYVGGDGAAMPPPPYEGIMHQIGYTLEKGSGRDLLVANLRFFAFLEAKGFGTPIYKIVIGQPTRALF